MLQEIEERREFLTEMESLGKGKTYRSRIMSEISQVSVYTSTFSYVTELLISFLLYMYRKSVSLKYWTSSGVQNYSRRILLWQHNSLCFN